MMSFVAMVTQPLLHLIYRLSESFAMGSESRKIVLVLFHELLLLIEPGAQGLAYGGVARGWHASMGSTPVQIAIEALEEVVGEANTDHP